MNFKHAINATAGFLLLASAGLIPASPASAHGAGCQRTARTGVAADSWDSGTNIEVHMRTVWNVCNTHVHPKYFVISITGDMDRSNFQGAVYDCVVRPDDINDRAIRMSGSLGETNTSADHNFVVDKQYFYPDHPRSTCTGRVKWAGADDDDYSHSVRAIS